MPPKQTKQHCEYGNKAQNTRIEEEWDTCLFIVLDVYQNNKNVDNFPLVFSTGWISSAGWLGGKSDSRCAYYLRFPMWYSLSCCLTYHPADPYLPKSASVLASCLVKLLQLCLLISTFLFAYIQPVFIKILILQTTASLFRLSKFISKLAFSFFLLYFHTFLSSSMQFS